MFTVGSLAPSLGGTLNSALGLVDLNGDTGNDQLIVDDSGDTTANTGTLTAAAVTGLGTGFSGVRYGTVETLAVHLGQGANTFTVTSTNAARRPPSTVVSQWTR